MRCATIAFVLCFCAAPANSGELAAADRATALESLAGIVNSTVVCLRPIKSDRYQALVDTFATASNPQFRVDLYLRANALMAEQRNWTDEPVATYCIVGAPILKQLDLLD